MQKFTAEVILLTTPFLTSNSCTQFIEEAVTHKLLHLPQQTTSRTQQPIHSVSHCFVVHILTLPSRYGLGDVVLEYFAIDFWLLFSEVVDQRVERLMTLGRAREIDVLGEHCC